MLRAFVELSTLDGIVLSSSVPQLVGEYQAFAERWAGVELLVLGPGVSTGVPIRYDDPREVGPDRISNAVAARERHGMPCIVVDFGTPTNFDVVSAAGESRRRARTGDRGFHGRAFARAARRCRGAARAPERVIRNDHGRAAVGSGLRVRGAGGCDRRPIREELGAPDAGRRNQDCGADRAALRTITTVDQELTLQGLRLSGDAT